MGVPFESEPYHCIFLGRSAKKGPGGAVPSCSEAVSHGRSLYPVDAILRGLPTLAVPKSPTKSPPLICVQSTPNTRSLIRAQGVLETCFLYGTSCTDHFRSFGCGRIFKAGKKHIAVNPCACSIFAPVNVWLPHDVTQSQHGPAFLFTKPYNAHGARDNSRFSSFFRFSSRDHERSPIAG